MSLHQAPDLVPHVTLAIDTTGQALRNTLTTLIGNLFAVILGFGALVALIRRRFVVVLELAGLAIVVASFVYVPDLWKNLGEAVAKIVQGG